MAKLKRTMYGTPLERPMAMWAVSISGDIGVCSMSNHRKSARPEAVTASCDPSARQWHVSASGPLHRAAGPYCPLRGEGWGARRTVILRSFMMMVRPSMNSPASIFCLKPWMAPRIGVIGAPGAMVIEYSG